MAENNNENHLDDCIVEDVDLYSVLGVSHKATQAEINSAFKKYSLMFHPDKHTLNNDNYNNAQKIFSNIREAYNILCDEKKRRVYDLYGMKGVKSENWEIVSRTSNPNELKYIYENMKRLEEQELQEKFTSPETIFTMKLDCSDIFDRYLKDSEKEYGPSIDINKTELRQSIVLGMTSTDKVSLSAVCSTSKGFGNGELVVDYKKYLYPHIKNCHANMQLGFTSDYQSTSELSISKTIYNKITFTLGTLCVMPEFLQVVPGLFGGMTWKITNNLEGNLRYHWNVNSKIETSLTWSHENGNHLLTGGFTLLSSKIYYANLRYNYIFRYPISKKSKYKSGDIEEKVEPVTFQCTARIGTNSCYGSLGVTRRVTKYTSFGMELTVGSPVGVKTELKFLRGNQLYIFPIIMSENVDRAATFYGTLVPMVIFQTVKRLMYDPWKRKEKEREFQKIRQESREELEKRRNEAYMTQSLMIEIGRRSYLREKNNGLLIERAMYGLLVSGIKMDSLRSNYVNKDGSISENWQQNVNDYSEDVINQKLVDVTVPLQVMVQNSQLEIPACRPGQSRGDLQGFYDPCMGLFSLNEEYDDEHRVFENDMTCTKEGSSAHKNYTTASRFNRNQRQLYVRYRFKGQLHETVVSDYEHLRVPSLDHIIEEKVKPY